jgi:hypothetical protein
MQAKEQASMVDLLAATLQASFDALNVAPVTDLAPVFTNVPANTQPPFIEIGAIDAEGIGGKDGGFERHTVEIEYQHRGNSRLPLLAMMNAGRSAMEAAEMITPGAELEAPRWLASATDREDDGVTYHGIQRFELTAQPED